MLSSGHGVRKWLSAAGVIRFACSARRMRFKRVTCRCFCRCIEPWGDGRLSRWARHATQHGNIFGCEAKAKETLIIDSTEPRSDALLRRVVFCQNEPPHQTRSCCWMPYGAYGGALLQTIGSLEMPCSNCSTSLRTIETLARRSLWTGSVGVGCHWLLCLYVSCVRASCDVFAVSAPPANPYRRAGHTIRPACHSAPLFRSGTVGGRCPSASYRRAPAVPCSSAAHVVRGACGTRTWRWWMQSAQASRTGAATYRRTGDSE